MKCKRNAIASVFNANASFFNANAYQMHSKCNANAFFRSICNANASNFNANASVFYANALLLHDIKEIYRFTLYISFHYIYRVGEKPPFAPKIGINFKNFEFFSKKLAWFVDLSYFCGVLHTARRLITANNNRWRYFYTTSERHIGIVPPWKSVMEILPCR